MHAIDPHQWSRSHFPESSKCDLQCNNICEAFNKTVLETRDKPIITMLETVRRIMMRRFVSKRLAATKWTNLVCPKIRLRLGVNMERSRKMTYHWAGDGHFEVQGRLCSHVVDLEKRTCDCREWQLTGLPCRHACSCLSFLRKNIELYTYDGYYVSTFAQTYDGRSPDSSTWPVLPLEKVIPYNIVKKVGRPKKARRRAPEEPRSKGRVSRVGTIITCKKCKQPGHNSRGCRNQNPASQLHHHPQLPELSLEVEQEAPQEEGQDQFLGLQMSKMMQWKEVQEGEDPTREEEKTEEEQCKEEQGTEQRQQQQKCKEEEQCHQQQQQQCNHQQQQQHCHQKQQQCHQQQHQQCNHQQQQQHCHQKQQQCHQQQHHQWQQQQQKC